MKVLDHDFEKNKLCYERLKGLIIETIDILEEMTSKRIDLVRQKYTEIENTEFNNKLNDSLHAYYDGMHSVNTKVALIGDDILLNLSVEHFDKCRFEYADIISAKNSDDMKKIDVRNLDESKNKLIQRLSTIYKEII
jgi:hypothetical protein